MMDVRSVLGADMYQDPSGVWRLSGHERFDYTDGAESEVYLERVLRQASDLSSSSVELEEYIRDWPSEYHLSPKRSKLLAGLRFDRSARVLEIGCGCGAITRYLGETFGSVLAVEGSFARARLARLRTRDLASVDIACAPFQSLIPKQRFDVIFCIGVFEYSGRFVDARDPFDQVLKLLASWLHPSGTLVVAIENQFGLKYFNGFREDHLGIRFEGLEGYHRRHAGPRTFGRGELTDMLARHFPRVEFLYPFPDYKIPSCVVRHDFLAGGQAAEIAAGAVSRDYHAPSRGFWDEGLVTIELGRNGMLPYMANSFLALASVTDEANYEFPQQAILYSDDRLPQMRAVTRVCEAGAGRLRARKSLAGGVTSVTSGPIRLKSCESDWQAGLSLEALTLARCRRIDCDLEEVFGLCRLWVRELRSRSISRDGKLMLPGSLIDATWSNSFAAGMELRLIDQEWEWHEDLSLSVVAIRAIYVFLCRADRRGALRGHLAARSGQRVITRIGEIIGVHLAPEDFAKFVQVESEIHYRVRGVDPGRTARMLRWYLIDRRLQSSFMRVKAFMHSSTTRVGRLLRAIQS